MPRVSRGCVEAQYYHIMVQGIGKEYIFENETMKNKYKELISKKSNLNTILIIAYCIMDNHAHILIKTEKNEHLSKMMAQINSSYGKFYNRIRNRVGYVFRDRYRAEPIYNINHLQNCVRYIHENPVKANMVKKCKEYIYSSYNDYINNKIDKKVIDDVYGCTSTYLNEIAGIYEDYNFIEINNEFGERKLEDFETVCKEYEKINFKEEKNVYKYSKELKKRTNATNSEIIKFLGVNRSTYYNIMKRQKS